MSEKDKVDEMTERELMFTRFVWLTFGLAGAIMVILALMAAFLV